MLLLHVLCFNKWQDRPATGPPEAERRGVVLDLDIKVEMVVMVAWPL